MVVQDYFTKWAEAIPLQNQTAVLITEELVKLCATYGLPEIVHSDQGRAFESTILRQTLEAFGTRKAHTSPYHPQGDGMVERFNRSLLQLLRTYVEKEEDWEQYLPLALYAYRTAQHSSTGISPFVLMFGRQPKMPLIGTPLAFDTGTYKKHLCAKFSELQGIVEANLVQASTRQKIGYDRHIRPSRQFKIGDPVWLSIPTAGKLSPRWEGNWRISSVKSPVTMEIMDGKRSRVVHINHRVQPDTAATPEVATGNRETWYPPQVEHFIVDIPTPVVTPQLPLRDAAQPLLEQPPLVGEEERRYPLRQRRPPDRL